MTKKTKISFFLIFLTILYSCKEDEPVHYKVPEPFKRYTVFNLGSYWIFMNDSTLETDSTYIKSNPVSVNSGSTNSNYNCTCEWIDVYYSSIFLGSSKLGVDLYGQGTTMYLYNKYFDSYGLIASSADNFIPFIEDKFAKVTYQTLSADTTLNVGLKEYYNVVNVQVSKDSQVFRISYAKDIGIIKMIGKTTENNFSWSLLRYHVER